MNILFYTQAPVMDDALTPHLSQLAKPTNWQTVSNATVLKVQKGTYRNAIFSGVFLVDEVETSRIFGPNLIP
jgi:hypothetical protein